MDNFYMEKMQESITNSFKDMLSGNVSPRTIQTKLRENITNLTKQSTENSTGPMNSTINMAHSISEKIPTKGFSKWNIFKIIFAIFIIGLLAINVFTYVKYGKDAFEYFLKEPENKEKNTEKNTEKNKEFKPSKILNEVTDDKATTAVHSSIDIEAEKLSQNEKVDEGDIEKALKKEKKKAYKANNISNNINKKVGYCYIGSDRNVRTCVKVGESDTCMSGEVFPTRDICINPNLKE